MNWPTPLPLRILGLLAVICVCLVLIGPALWLFLTSMMTEVEAKAVPPVWLPAHPSLQNYWTLLAPSQNLSLMSGGAVAILPRALFNSIFVGICVAILNLAIGLPAAYALARLEFRGVKGLLLFYLSSRMIPGVAIVIPMFLLFRSMGLIDTTYSIILAHTGFTLPFTIWILRSYLLSLPRDLEDAAIVDRCSFPAMVWRIIVPVARPGLVTAGLFAFMSSWGEFMFALIFSASERAKTLPVVVAELATDIDMRYTLLAAGGIIALLPPLAIAFLFQRLIVSGLLSGSVKS